MSQTAVYDTRRSANARVSKADGSQSLGLSRDALRPAGQSAYVRVEVPEPEPEPELALPLLGQLLLALGLLRLGVMRLSRRGRHMMRWRRAAAREPRVGCATSAVWRDDRLGRTLVHLVNYVGPQGQSREGHRPAAQIWLEPWLGCSTYQSGLLTLMPRCQLMQF